MFPSTVFMLCFFLQSAHVVPSAAASNGDPSLLELDVGLNLSMSASASFYVPNPNDTFFFPMVDSNSMFTVGMTAYGAYFLPILSSSGFNSSNSSNSLGFSVGFLFSASGDDGLSSNIYLAICGGLSGNYSNLSSMIGLKGSNNGDTGLIIPWITPDGYVVPVWIANLDKPLRSVKSSLVVVEGSDVGGASSSNELQLRDHDGSVVWRVSNVSRMEMQNTGNLVIYESMNTTNVVWQSSTQPRDSLLQGQMLTVGKELTSNDSSYLARMEKGGLVLYDKNAHFIEQPSPYWVIPILLNTSWAINVFDLNALVFLPPCTNPNDEAYGRLDNSSVYFLLQPGSCRNTTDTAYVLYGSAATSLIPAWSFVRLEKDGRLYSYSVDSGTSPPSISQPYELSWLASPSFSSPLPYSSHWWGECNVPMACGPLGVCSQGAETLCACPVSSSGGVNFLTPTDNNNLFKGCNRSTPLPTCSSGNEHIDTTDFLQLNQTASIFLFGGWAFNFTSASVEKCKELCSSKCSCHGFFYQANSSACFFITNEISLLNVTDKNFTFSSSYNIEIFGRNYITYLKVTSATSSTNKHAMIAIVVLSTFLACLVFGFPMYLLCARKRANRARMREHVRQAKEEEELRDILPLLPSRFSYQDLHEATKAFSKLLGAGGCGSVYAGVLPDGREIAVKILEFVLLKGHSKQFLAEVATMGRTSHHNIVCLVGFCWEVSNRLLVYEYVERGSLDHWLFVKEGAEAAESAPLLDWKTRYNVALGIARGLSYLHEDCPQPILHFDIKPQNILLDGAFVAKLADFGMSRLMQRDVSEVVTGVRGTPGYIAPEWVSHGAVSKKSDVYSMGMVMLEIVGGRRNVDLTLLDNTLDPEEWYFPSWAAKKCRQGLIMQLVDKRLQTVDEEQAQRLIHTAFWCIHENPSMRPYVPTVVQWLEGSFPVKEPPFSIANSMSHPPPEFSCEGASLRHCQFHVASTS